ncbi:MAG TPA: protein kinase [Dehalococcoidia bacterium]|nr:protein kinase [Dehalococcoidia bacterium]
MTTPPMPPQGRPTTDRIPEGTVLGGRYQIQDILGVGGMAIVYRAEDQLLRRPVAVKVMAEWLRHDEAYARRFTEEAQSAARLNHANVVTVYDTEEEEARRYIVMEFVDGRSLKEYLDDVAILEEQDAVEVAVQVADALEYGHQNGVIHCDVKPGNILVDRRGRAKIVDFGIARAATQTWAMATTVLGTAAYMAPENVEGARPDARSDVYSLGLVLYEMLAGRLPFEGESVAAVTAQRLVKDPIPLRRFNPEVTPQLEAIIMRSLARDPAMRPQTAGELGDMLRTHMAGQQVALGAAVMPPPPGSTRAARARPAPISRPPRRGGSGWWTIIGGIIVAVALFALAFGITAAALGLFEDDNDNNAEPTPTTPVETPTEAPTEEPTAAPTESPTEAPTEVPTEEPTAEPTEAPEDPCAILGLPPDCEIITPEP